MVNKAFDDFKVGEIFDGSYRRTMTEAELVAVVHLAGLRTPLFIDEEWCRKNVPDGQRRFPGFLGIGVANPMYEDYVGHGHFGVSRLERVVFAGGRIRARLHDAETSGAPLSVSEVDTPFRERGFG